MLDTGIWSERPSFSDEGLSPVPSKWKGTCVVTPDFPATACNTKITGARAFYLEYQASRAKTMEESNESKSPREMESHGTHTASTATGSRVANASPFGYAKGEKSAINAGKSEYSALT
ncbi:Subtilase family protein [Abeliophyllum distichum]|uniref:Subtilase family protein n=1 Tax=Abeliophyllum distichum TaxID=126358 RepID=A0ABD1QYA7_9LAMI